jgi:hypothetical protein
MLIYVHIDDKGKSFYDNFKVNQQKARRKAIFIEASNYSL